ncbi:MAG: hypothetical protein AAB071_03555 [Bacteroidota bacterium]
MHGLSLVILHIFSILLFISFAKADGPTFIEQGVMSGSGFTFLPSATPSPMGDFRIQMGRMQLFEEKRGLDVLTLSGGFSSHLETYMKLSSEQQGTPFSLLSFGFGGKFRVPVSFPVVEKITLWMESVTSEEKRTSAINPSEVKRIAAIYCMGSYKTRIVGITGVTQTEQRSHLLYGGGFIFSPLNTMQFGIEYLHGYASENSEYVIVNISTRVFENIGVYVNPGILNVASRKIFSLSVGVSLTTTSLDFLPEAGGNGHQIKIPTFEEIQQQSQEEEKK